MLKMGLGLVGVGTAAGLVYRAFRVSLGKPEANSKKPKAANAASRAKKPETNKKNDQKNPQTNNPPCTKTVSRPNHHQRRGEFRAYLPPLPPQPTTLLWPRRDLSTLGHFRPPVQPLEGRQRPTLVNLRARARDEGSECTARESPKCPLRRLNMAVVKIGKPKMA